MKGRKEEKRKSKKSEKSKEHSEKSEKSSSKKKVRSKAVSKADSSIIDERNREETKSIVPTQHNHSLIFNSGENSPKVMPTRHDQNPQLYPPQKCDGCFEGEAECFCKECNKQFCNLCNEQIHIIPSMRNHQRVPISEIISLKKLCFHHNNVLEFYCETCNEPICYECQVVGPHNTKLHRITSIQEAYYKKYNQLLQFKPVLITKISQLNSNNCYITQYLEKIKYSKKNIERDVRKQYTELTEKIKSIEGKKTAVLSFETSQLQKQINSINDIINYVNDLSNSAAPDIMGFLLRYKQIMAMIEKIIQKPIKQIAELQFTNDFPNDLAERHRKLEDYDRIKKNLVKRDELIWNLIVDKKRKENQMIMDAKEKSKNDIAEWVKLSDRYAVELKKYTIVCSFCGKYLDNYTVNSRCEANEKFCLPFFFTKVMPPGDKINIGYHYFSEPISNLEEKLKEAEDLWKLQQQELLRQMKEEEEKKKKEKEKQEAEKARKEKQRKEKSKSKSKSPRTKKKKKNRRSRSCDFEIKSLGILPKIDDFREVQGWVIKIAQAIQSENIDFLGLLREYDLDEDGVITARDLELALKKVDSQLSAEDFGDILKYLKLTGSNEIRIEDFAKNFNSQYMKAMKSSDRSRSVTTSQNI